MLVGPRQCSSCAARIYSVFVAASTADAAPTASNWRGCHRKFKLGAPSTRAVPVRHYSRFASTSALAQLQLPFLAPKVLRDAMAKGNGSLRARTHTTKAKALSTNGNENVHNHDEHDHDHDHDHEHSHSHSIFGHTHSRDEGPSKEVESVMKVLEGRSADAGSRITIVGLVVNVGLTISKAGAGWFMNSAALLAEAGHSASDLLGDFVTLFSWRVSKRSPTARYPYGFGKFETLGTTTLALILIGGALGIGFHSFSLLSHHLGETVSALPPGAAQQLMQNVTQAAQTVTGKLPVHDAHVHALDPNAAWFAAASVLAKEWLYRATRRVAKEERSKVLLANAVHHRADAYTSMVALCAILGTWWFPALPLDPLGGLLVSLVILRQGVSLFAGAFGELTDAGVSQRTHRALLRALVPLISSSSASSEFADPALLEVTELRAMRSGATMFVDVSVRVPRALSVLDAVALERRIRDALIAVRSEITEVRVKFLPIGEEDGLENGHQNLSVKESKS